jgi:hypothetical protein
MKPTHLVTLGVLLATSIQLQAQQGADPVLDRFSTTNQDEFERKLEPFYLPNKLVQPPVFAWDVKKALYTINAAEGGVIQYITGTKIYVPQNAFVDAQGKPVTGAVQIDYREYKDPVDFVFSGIPMTYDSGGVSNTFESAGMFDIAASQEGRQVFLAKSKPLKMDFVSTDSSTSYNFYVLDQDKGWVNKGKTAKPEVKKTNLCVPSNSSAVQTYLNLQRWKNRYRMSDTTNFASRYSDTSYYYTHLKGSGYNTTYRFFAFNRTLKLRKSSMVDIRRVPSGKRAEKAFSMVFEQSEFPELRAFNKFNWVLTDKESTASFKEKYGRRNSFGDIRIEPEGDAYAITLKSDKGFKVLHAYPITPSSLAKKEHQASNSAREMKSSARILARREKKFNKEMMDLKREIARNQAKKVSTPQQNWQMARSQMLPEEKKMSFPEWDAYCMANINKEKKDVAFSNATETNIIRSLELDGMGVYNCDQIQQLNKPVIAYAKYEGTDGKPVHTKTTYVIDSRINSILRYDGYNGFSANKIAYSAQSENVLISIGCDGSVAYANVPQFVAGTSISKTSPDFSVSVADPGRMSVEDFRKKIGYK